MSWLFDRLPAWLRGPLALRLAVQLLNALALWGLILGILQEAAP